MLSSTKWVDDNLGGQELLSSEDTRNKVYCLLDYLQCIRALECHLLTCVSVDTFLFCTLAVPTCYLLLGV